MTSFCSFERAFIDDSNCVLKCSSYFVSCSDAEVCFVVISSREVLYSVASFSNSPFAFASSSAFLASSAWRAFSFSADSFTSLPRRATSAWAFARSSAFAESPAPAPDHPPSQAHDPPPAPPLPPSASNIARGRLNLNIDEIIRNYEFSHLTDASERCASFSGLSTSLANIPIVH